MRRHHAFSGQPCDRKTGRSVEGLSTLPIAGHDCNALIYLFSIRILWLVVPGGGKDPITRKVQKKRWKNEIISPSPSCPGHDANRAGCTQGTRSQDTDRCLRKGGWKRRAELTFPGHLPAGGGSTLSPFLTVEDLFHFFQAEEVFAFPLLDGDLDVLRLPF